MKYSEPPDSLSPDHTVSSRWVVIAIGVLASTGPLDAQVIEGRVLDVVSDRALTAVRVVGVHSERGDSVTVLTSAAGTFVLRLPDAGIWNVSASRLGYRSTPQEVEVGAGQTIQMTLRLDRSELLLDSVVVLGNAVPLRHLGTWDGFQARYEQRKPVGPTRLIRRGDLAFRGSTDIAQMLRSVRMVGPSAGEPCIFIDGVRRPGWTPELVLGMSSAQVRGVEYYAEPLDAPLEFREGKGCPILAIWRMR